MISVVVYAQKPEGPAQLVANVLSRYGRTELHQPASLAARGSGERCYVVEAVSRIDRLMLPQAVLLFADRTAPRQLALCEKVIVVAGADNRRVSRLLCGRPNPVVTCGTGLRDTLTLSSSAGDRAVLCAQRRIPTLTGELLEPFEFAVELKGKGINTALLAAGTAAVCGCDLSGKELSLDSTEPW